MIAHDAPKFAARLLMSGCFMVAVWLSGNALVSTNEVTLRWAWLALRRVTVCRRVSYLDV